MRSRDLQQGRIHDSDVSLFEIIDHFMTGPPVNIDGAMLQDEFIVFPFGKILKAVAAHDNSKLMRWVFFLQIRQGVHRIGWLRQPEFYIADF